MAPSNAALPLHTCLQTSYPLRIFSLCTLTTASCSWLFFYTSCFLFSATPLRFFNGMLTASEPGAMNYYNLCCLIMLNLFVSRNLTIIYLLLFERSHCDVLSLNSADLSGELLSPLTCSCFLLLLLGRFSLLAFTLPLGASLPSLWSALFPLHAPALIPFSLAQVRLSHTFTLSHLTIWCSGQMALFLLAKAALVFLLTTLSVALKPLSFSAGPVC